MAKTDSAKPVLSIIVIFHNMRREATRTLHTLATPYQQGVSGSDYEVIAIDNGSTHPLDSNQISDFGPNFSYHFFDTNSVSPVDAVNFGVIRAQGEYVGIIVDGARMVTPGLIFGSINALNSVSNPFVGALAWHLGPDDQLVSIANGYNRVQEDALLDSINWRDQGYRLFDISTLAPSSSIGFYGGIPVEFSWSVIKRTTFLELGGFERKFQSPGGGLVNQDYLKRVLSLERIDPVILLGEGSFHQIHGGVATNAKPDALPFKEFATEYRTIRGKNFVPATNIDPSYIGSIPDNAVRFTKESVEKALPLSQKIKRLAKGWIYGFFRDANARHL